VSSNSQPTAVPAPAKLHNSSRAIRSPLFTWKDSLMFGSLIRPFHPTVVLGFSRYARIMIRRSSPYLSATFLSFVPVFQKRKEKGLRNVSNLERCIHQVLHFLSIIRY